MNEKDEACDQGAAPSFSCKSDCSGPEDGWACTYGNGNPDAICSEICGDGIKVGEELCDDGN